MKFQILPLPGSRAGGGVIPVVLPVITAVVLPVVDYRASHSRRGPRRDPVAGVCRRPLAHRANVSVTLVRSAPDPRPNHRGPALVGRRSPGGRKEEEKLRVR